MKTADLIGPALDWAVCKVADFFKAHHTTPKQFLHIWKTHPLSDPWFHPSIDWAQGGPIIEREKIAVLYPPSGETQWRATLGKGVQFGPTPLVAAMRCYVASKLGDEVEIPEEIAS